MYLLADTTFTPDEQLISLINSICSCLLRMLRVNVNTLLIICKKSINVRVAKRKHLAFVPGNHKPGPLRARFKMYSISFINFQLPEA